MRIILAISGVLLFLSWLLPTHFDPWPTAYQEFLAALALILATTGLLFLHERIIIKKEFLLILLIGLIPLIQFSTGIISYAGDAILASSYICALAFSILLGFNLQINKKTQSTAPLPLYIAWLFTSASILSSVIALSQWIGHTDLFWVFPISEGSRPSANLAQPNNLATLLGMGIAAVIFLYEKNKLHHIFASLFIFILISGIVLTQSRTAWLAAIFVMAFWSWNSRKITLRTSNKTVLLWVTLFAFMSFLLPIFSEAFSLQGSSPIERAKQLQRAGIYIQFMHAIFEGPWHGYGWGNIFSAQAAVATEQSNSIPTFYTHNVLLDLLIWNGPIAGLFIITGTAYWLIDLIRKTNNITSVFAWLALIFIILHSMLEYPHAYLFFLIPAGILLGIIQATQEMKTLTIKMHKALTCIAVVFSFALLFFLWSDYRIIEADYLKATTENPSTATHEKKQAVSNVIILTNMREYIYFLRSPIDKEYSEEEIKKLVTISNRYPYFYSLLKIAYIHALHGNPAISQNNLKKIKGLYGDNRYELSIQYFIKKSEENPALLKAINPENQ